MAASAQEVSSDLLTIPEAFLCPVTLEVMKNPVVTADGHTYERTAIEKWLMGHRTSPLTNEPLAHTTLIPNHTLRNNIEEYMRRMPEIQRQDIQKRQETMNLQEIIRLRESEATDKHDRSEAERERLIRDMDTAIRERLQIEDRLRIELARSAQLAKELEASQKRHVPPEQENKSLKDQIAREQAERESERQEFHKYMEPERQDRINQKQRFKQMEQRFQGLEIKATASAPLYQAPKPAAALQGVSGTTALQFAQPAPIAAPANLPTFLNHVAAGQQDEAEALLKANPALGLAKGDVADPAGRKFQQITALQYATWALDWHMWKMLLKFIPQEAARTQAAEFKTGPWVATHGEHAGHTIQTLIDALKVYIDNYQPWSGEQCRDHCIHKVGGAQRLLPTHVLHEYCRPDRPFNPTPTFTESAMPRTLKYYDYNVSSEKLLNLSDLGSNFGFFRATDNYSFWQLLRSRTGLAAVNDRVACVRLLDVRTNQRDELIASLTQTAKAAPKLK